MCGISGIFDLRGRAEIDRGLLQRMNDVQAHRGPDGAGLHLEPGLGLGHRRLAIIDLAGGRQPMTNEDGSVVVVFNGEIYNFPALRRTLEVAGHRFQTQTDTEVIVHGWEEWGPRCVERFRGMFAFAVWDRGREQLFLARDRLGIKPLHYALAEDGRLLFGSELKVLLQYPRLARTLDPKAVEDYFAYGYVPAPRTILRGVHKLEAGHWLLLKRGRSLPEPHRYWDLSFRPGPRLPEDRLGDELTERLREAVEMRLVADVPLGAFLSGGVDSSAVVAFMTELMQEPVRTCSISFGDPRYNESRYAQQVSQRFATDHRVEQVDPEDFSLIDRLVAAYDEPYADSSAIPTYRVCELARRHVTVALSGDGGDENFAGYRRYRWHRYEESVRRRLPGPLRAGLFGLLGRVYPKLDWAPKILRAKSTFQALARDSLEGYLHSVSIFPTDLRRRLFSDGFRRELQGYGAIEVLRRHADRSPTDHPLSLVQYLDFKTYLPGDILTKVDRASMAHGLEVRVPLLDHAFADWVSGIDPGCKLRGREGKYLFKRALRSRLPEEILYRPKMGFAVPISRWFREGLRDRVRTAVLGERLADTGIFRREVLTQLVERHQSGRSEYSAVLWALLMFDGFLRLTLETPTESVPTSSVSR